jgi:hypothetical protein
MTDGPGSVSTLILVVVRSIEEGGGELLFPGERELAELGIEGVPDWVGGKGEGGSEKDVDKDKVESESIADARAATIRMRTVEVHMNA